MPSRAQLIWPIGIFHYFLGIAVAAVSSFILHQTSHRYEPSHPSILRPSYLTMTKSGSSPSGKGERRQPFSANVSSNPEAVAVEILEDQQGLEDLDECCSILDDFGCEAYETILLDSGEDRPDLWIRIQGAPDECLQGIETQEDVFLKINEIRAIQSIYGRADLYARSWNSLFEDVEWIRGEVNGVSLRNVNGVRANSTSISAMQFNTLAEGLSAGPNVKRPFEQIPAFIKDNKKNNFGGFTNIQSPEMALDFSMRRWRLVEVMLGKGSLFDILALEEVDRYHGFFYPILKLFGYQGIFMPKIRAPGFNLGWYSDGCALLWKSNTFELVSERRMVYTKGTQVLILATLRHLETGEVLVVATTHLKASRSVENEKIRCEQVEELLRRVEEQVSSATSHAGSKQVRTLILGDFNSDPPEHAPLKNSCVRMVLNHGRKKAEEGRIRYLSTYPVDPPDPGYLTTWKTRGTETVQRVIDYIFYSDDLKCTHTFGIPDIAEMEEDQLPSLRYPSDHLMIAATFEL